MSTYDFEPNPDDYGPEPAHIANGTKVKKPIGFYPMIAHGHEFDCKFDYEPAEPAWGDDPAWPATYTLISALYEGIEVLPILDPAIVHTLEEQRRTE
jgi:hypothetical protein